MKVGDKVKLIRIPYWLVHDLRKEERQAIENQLNKVLIIEEIDEFGYYWLTDGVRITEYSQEGFPTFCVTIDCLCAQNV